MFDYIKNKYNLSPLLFLEKNLKKDFLYIPYVEAPFLTLPENQIEFKSSHKRKFWYNIRRSEKLFEADHGELNFEIIKDEPILGFYLNEVFNLFNKRWSDEYTSCSWKTIEGFNIYKKAMIDLASSNEAFLAILTNKNGKLLSYGYCLIQDEVICFYQHSTETNDIFRKYSLGKILVCNLLKYSIDCKYKQFDFMAGQTSYKFEWAKSTRMIYREIGKKNIINYIKLFIFKIRYLLQFNIYSRSLLKFIMKYLEKTFGKLKVRN